MAERMNRDLNFDHSEAVVDLAFSPRAFQLGRKIYRMCFGKAGFERFLVFCLGKMLDL